MNKALLDTDIYSEIMRARHPHLVVTAENYFNKIGYYTISSITVMEIVKGLRKKGGPERLELFLVSLKYVEVLSLDRKSGEIAGKIIADLERTGQTIGIADPMIASIALTHNLTIATGNTSHFLRIVDLGYPLLMENKEKEAIQRDKQ